MEKKIKHGFTLDCRSALLSRQKKAFTLAEVLITLTIIGVVAAVTVPTLTKKTGNQEYVTRLQKIYSVLSQATDEIILENGSPKNGWATTSDNVYNLYKEQLRNAKECGPNSGCWAESNTSLDGNTWNNVCTSGHKKLILSDGISVLFEKNSYVSSSCNKNWDGKYDDCTSIYVDLNGKKAPNRLGRDIFHFVVKADGLYPDGCNNDSADCYSNSIGLSCACKVLSEGKIDY